MALGGIAKFDIRVVGKPEPVVEWFKNGKQIEDQGRFIIIDEVDEQDKELFSLVIEQCEPDDDNEYMVVAMNEAGKDTSTCHLFVSPKTVTEELEKVEESVLEGPSADIIDSAMPGTFLVSFRYLSYYFQVTFHLQLIDSDLDFVCILLTYSGMK